MLKALRNKKTAKKIWIMLAILIVPAFVLWGSGSIIRSKQEATYAGRIFGKTISILEYKDALSAVRNMAIMQFGDNLAEAQKYFSLEAQAWERIALLLEAKKRKISVNDNEVIRLIQSNPYFQRNGIFDNRVYEESLHYVFHTQPRIFEEQTRQNLALSKLYKLVTDNIAVTDEEIKAEYQRMNEEISIYYMAALTSDFAKGLLPSEQDLKDYFMKNSLDFKQPLSFNIEYITLESEDRVQEVNSRLKQSKDFTKVAGDLGLAVKETGLFGQTDPIPGIGWSPEISNLLSKLNVGELPVPIQKDKNYYILRLKEKKEAYIPDFQKVKDKVKETFIKDESGELAKAKINDTAKKLKELYGSNPALADFEKLAKEYGLKYDATGNFKYGSYIEGVGASDTFWMAASQLKDGESSDIIAIPSGFYIIKLKSRTPVDEKKFESEKIEFSQKLLSLKKQEYFAKFIEELKRKAQIF